MIIEVDLVEETILLLDASLRVVDAFRARGITRHEVPPTARFYTYRAYLTLPGNCAVCGLGVEALHQPCSSSGGYHAMVGLPQDQRVPPEHKVENRDLPIHTLSYDELVFFVEKDNLFDIGDLGPALIV